MYELSSGYLRDIFGIEGVCIFLGRVATFLDINLNKSTFYEKISIKERGASYETPLKY